MREAILLIAARLFMDGLSPAERQEVEDLARELERDADLNGDSKVTFFVLPRPMRLFLGSRYWIVYDAPDAATVELWAIGRAWDAPPRLT